MGLTGRVLGFARGVALGTVVVSTVPGCGGDGGVRLSEAQEWAGSNVLVLTIEECDPDPDLEVVAENAHEVRVRASAEHNDDACAGRGAVCLAAPLDGRLVVDDRSGEPVPVLQGQ